MLQRLIGLLCLIAVFNPWLPASTWAQDTAAKSSAPGPQPPVILVFGDSLSSGHGVPTTQTWAALFQRRLTQLGYPHRVVNASISGDTTASGLARLPSALRRHNPEIVILELGGNDGLRGLSLPALRANLASIIQTARQGRAKIVLAGMRMPPNYGISYAKEFERVFAELANEYQVTLIPFFLDGVAAVPDMMQGDGIHPTAEAQPVLLENVWQHVAPLL